MKHKKMLLLLIVVVIILGGIFCYKKLNLSKNTTIKTEDEIETEEATQSKLKGELKISNGNNNKENKIINILLLGIDKEENASDTIMIISLNEKKKTIKLVSIMRDTYVYQGENMANKINYAYHYGGTKGAIDTINSIFNLDISKYVKVDFEGLISIVDKLDGVEVDINEAERKFINATCDKYILNNSGKVRLNGEQALAFSRIRKIDSDFERTQRQRKVMRGIFQGIKKIDSFKYPKMIYTLSKASETNLSIKELLEVGNVIYRYDESKLGELRIPIDGTSWDSSSGPYHLNWDEAVNKKALHDFIYE